MFFRKLNGKSVITLTKEVLYNNLSEIVELDKYLMKIMSTMYSDIGWSEENFLLDLKGKWKYSKIALDEENLIGFWIVSTTIPYNIHTHRVGIKPNYQGKGIGKVMFKAVIEGISESSDPIDNMTLEVNKQNENAINFYEKLGFIKMKEKEIRNYLLSRGRQALIFDDFIRENNGTEFYVYKRKIEVLK